MAKALTNIQFGDEDGNVTMYPAGADVPDNVMQALRGADFAVDEPLEVDIADAPTSDATIEIAPGISARNPKLMTEEELDEFDEDGFRDAVESIRNRPLTATSGEPSYGRIPATETDNGFLTMNDQRTLNRKHRAVVERVVRAEKERVPVGSAVAGQNPQVPAARIAAGPAGFRRATPADQPQRSRAQLRAGTGTGKGAGRQEGLIERQQREREQRAAEAAAKNQGGQGGQGGGQGQPSGGQSGNQGGGPQT
jgi:hypothetical protein